MSEYLTEFDSSWLVLYTVDLLFMCVAYVCVYFLYDELLFTFVQFQLSRLALDADYDFCNQRNQPAQ